jgi:hypothetical protein
MAKGSVRLGAALLTLAALGAPVDAQSAPELRVRAYNAFGVASAEVAHALRTAEAIFRAAGLAAAWRECRTPAGPSAGLADRCDDTVSRSEMILRIVAAPASLRGPNPALGFSNVDVGAGVGTLATVFGDRVRSTAVRAGIDPGVLLGRVVAHEIGHLLLGTMEHATDGLMRGHWPDPALRAGTPRDWVFSGVESAHLLRAARARADALQKFLVFRRAPAVGFNR